MLKKASILTFHYAHNYGATLQAFALKRQLELLGCDVSIINYQNRRVASSYMLKLKVDLLQICWLNPKNWGKLLRLIPQNRFAQEDWTRQWACFREFITTEFDDNDKAVLFDDLKKIDTEIFFVGSDQIWNKYITHGLDRGYFLDFKTSAKKASYAASSTDRKFGKSDERKIKKYLSQFSCISVREKTLADKLGILLEEKICTVLDPSLLLDIEQYEPLMAKRQQISEKFVFAYFVFEEDNLMRCAKKIAEKLEVTLIELHYYKCRDLTGHNQIADIGPREFLWYMKHAEYILTNSFHGTVFAILNSKNFYSVYANNKNGRIENLLSHLGITDRHIENEDGCDVYRRVDYLEVRKRLKCIRQESINFLKHALEIEVL